MKKLTMIVTILGICLFFSLTVFGQEPAANFELINWQPDQYNFVSVSGRGNANCPEDEASLVIYHQETKEVVFADQQTVEPGKNFQFHIMPITETFPEGVYVVRVSGALLGTVVKNFYLADKDRAADILQQLAETSESQMDVLLATKAEDGLTYGEILGIDMESYGKLEDKNILFSLLAEGNKDYMLPDAPAQEEIDMAMSKLKKLYQDAYAIQSWQNSRGDGEARAWWMTANQTSVYGSAAYDPRYDLDGETDPLSAAEDLKMSLQKRAAAHQILVDMCSADVSDNGRREKAFAEILSQFQNIDQQGYLTWKAESWETQTLTDYYLSGIRNQIVEGQILAAVTGLPQGYGMELLENPLLFNKLTKYSVLSESKKAAVLSAVWGKEYDNLESFISAVEQNAQKQNQGDGISGGGTGTGGGSGGRGGLTGIGSGNGAVITTDGGQNQETSQHFNDLDSVAWAVPAIEALYAKGVVQGYGNGDFKPNYEITRAEFVKMLMEAFGLTNDNSVCDFQDVAPDAWYYAYVASAVQAGLVNGVGDGLFEPERTITREEISAVLYRTAAVSGREIPRQTELHFSDSDDIAEYAREAVASLTETGIINGMGDGTFAPQEPATRAQAAKLIYGLLQK
ncbi:S-layer homology domain-containing protein [Ructibacterium gallinarum]|uniref:S-layer homology domain-containing protein n=1 Tax=Ructibacterium gallinarum TaxID=2779355 RepID=A0A9D5LZI5_9FIRM|nr:S-layer homology domain-containing protein [Ructibacterium gallinarum]MBE5040938.1 S-layer homology domain-containing protein [Ructibacterium gallinarum]